jgi:crossover junction endodeoxyribonuclease RusA
VRECATEAVAVATQGNMTAPPFVDVPLRISIQFRLSRPAGHYGKKGIKPKAPPWPSKKPDLDKLLRSTKDSLKGIVYDDDSRIVRVDAEKIYAAVGNEGATIVVERASSFT